MADAWVVRPKPHGTNRLNEFLEGEIVAVGWPSLSDLSTYTKRDIREQIKDIYGQSSHELGQNTGQINRFVNEMSVDDLVLVPSGGNIYLGKIQGQYEFVEERASDEEGYPHQRKVEWCHGGAAIDRSSLPGKLHDTLKGRLTVFSADYSLANQLKEEEASKQDVDPYVEVESDYLERLQAGELNGMIDSNFEKAARLVLREYYPTITNVAGSVNPEGDTDLLAESPGGVTVRVQVKHYYTDRGKLGPEPVEQLAASMDEGDSGIVLTSTEIGEKARDAAESSANQIGFVDGEEFVELLFENLDEFTSEELNTLGLRSQPPCLL
ncbi:restriction endonuclease [Halomontanus rarus]|uniref:restriction endonuclease n=1 Tax=Halomontanus rarus TaxID=3034020 RepID=UPI00293BB7E6|nr:restriction endonuclease [Halovivax sp. KZCA124]